MKIQNLKIKGFLSYQEEVEIDFTQFDLACIVGDNGAGKSSILDAMTWALFGKCRQSNESLINLQSDVAVVTFSFEYAGESYKIRRSNKRGKPARLTLKTPELDLTERTTRDTQNKIEQILKINYETFVHAVFFLQGDSDQFVTASPGARKQVLFDILGLDAWEKFRLSAAVEIKTIEKSMEQAQGSMQVLEEGIAQGADVSSELNTLDEEIYMHEEKLDNAQAALDEAQKKMDAWEKEKQELADLYSQGRKAQEKQKSIETRLTGIAFDQKENDEILSRKEQITKDYARAQDVRSLLVAMRDKEVEYSPLVHDLNVAREALHEIEDDLLKIPEIEKNIKEWEKQAKEEAGYVTVLDAKKEKAIKLDADVKNLISKKRDLQDQIAGLAGHESCPLCEQELKDPAALINKLQKGIAGIEANVVATIEEMDGGLEERHRLASLLGKVKGAEALISPAKETISSIKVAEATFDHGKIDEIRIAITDLDYSADKMTEYRNESALLENASRDHGLLEGAEKAGETLETQAAGLRQDYIDIVATVKENQAQIETKESIQGESPITDNDLVGLKYEVGDAKTRLQARTRRAGELNQLLKTINDQKEKLKEIKAQEKENTDLHQKYSTLQEAFSKKGVPALLVEQALPQIESKANQLLHRLSDGQMAVHFITQKAYADGSREDMKETLDIEIQDQAGIRDYEMFSGGESFRINFAIRMALSHVLANRAGAKLRTLVIDEGFGSQDAGGRDRLINAINTVKAEYDKVLVITHIQEVIESFPVQLRVEKTAAGSQVRIL